MGIMCDKPHYDVLVERIVLLENATRNAMKESSLARQEIASLRQDTNASLNAFRKSVEELVEVMHSVGGFFKTLGWIGTAIKWTSVTVVSSVAMYEAILALIKFRG